MPHWAARCTANLLRCQSGTTAILEDVKNTRGIFLFFPLYCVMEAVFFTFTLIFSFAVYAFPSNIRGTKTHFLCARIQALTESTYLDFVADIYKFCANINDLAVQALCLGGLRTFWNVKFTFTALRNIRQT